MTCMTVNTVNMADMVIDIDIVGVDMVDIEDFITTLFVFVDDFCQGDPPIPRPGPDCKFTDSEAMTLLIFGQWGRFSSERDFYRFARKELRYAFPDLPTRPQLNRQWRSLHDKVCTFFSYLADVLDAPMASYQILDATAVVTRNAKRRGDGWLKLISVVAVVWVGMRVSTSCWQPLPKVLSVFR